MPLPAGITTCTVNIGVPRDWTGDTDIAMDVDVQPTHDLVWAATGDPILAFPIARSAAAGMVAQVVLPHTDQAGFVDAAGDAFTNWAYSVQVTWRNSKGARRLTVKALQLLVGQTVVDFDAIPTGNITTPVTAPTAAVLSVNGDTGHVTVATGGGTLDSLSDVDTTGVTDGQGLVWDSGTSEWVPGALAPSVDWSTITGKPAVIAAGADAAAARTAIGAGTSDLALGGTGSTAAAGNHTHSLGDLSDVDTAGASTGQVLGWDGTQWEPVTGGGGAVDSVNGATGVVVLDAADVDAVPTARQITAGTGLTGGGDLTADRTLTVTYGTTAGTAAQGNDGRLSDARTPTAHTHPAADVSDSTAAGRAVLTAADAPAQRTALGLGDVATRNVGTTAGTAAAGDHTHTAAAVGAAPTSHTHPAADISDSTSTGRSVLTAADAAAARTAIGAGTSSLALGTSGSTAAAGDHTHSGMVTSATITTIWSGTQAAYDALGSWSSTTLYIIQEP